MELVYNSRMTTNQNPGEFRLAPVENPGAEKAWMASAIVLGSLSLMAVGVQLAEGVQTLIHSIQ
jgi:hypothetical protein